MQVLKRGLRRARHVVVLALLASVAGAAMAAGSVVISQAYGGGGNSGATYKNDFVELHNVSSAPVDITDWSVQYASATGSSITSTTRLSGTIPAGGYYLVQMAPGAGGTVDLPTPDAIGTTAMGGTAFKVFLVNHSTPITWSSCADIAAKVVDYLGAGTTASCYEGSGPAPAPSNVNAVIRRENGCQDTDDNSADFDAGPPTPRNSASPAVICGGPAGPTVDSVTFAPDSVSPGDAFVNINAIVTPGAASVTSVTADFSPIGLAASVPLSFTGLEWTASFDVPATAPAGAHTITVTATDANGTRGAGIGTLNVEYQGAPITVAQARALGPTTYDLPVRGIVATNSVGNAYIVDPDGKNGIIIFDGTPNDGTSGLDNGIERPLAPGDQVIVNGHIELYAGELEVNAGSVAKIIIEAAGQTVPPASNITVAQATASDDYEGRLISISQVTVTTAPATVSSNAWTFIAEDAGGNAITVYVHRNATSIANTPPGVPAHPIPAASGTPITLTDVTPGNVYKLGGMLSEFSSQTPAKQVKPRDAGDFVLLKTSLIVSATATPSIVERGGTLTLTVKTAPATGSTVLADLTGLGGSANTPLVYNAGSGAYTLSVPVGASAPLGPVNILIAASNPAYNAGEVTTTTLVSTVTTPVQTLTIAQARAVEEWAQVSITGEATNTTGAVGTGQTYLQDNTGGVYLFGATSTGFVANPGDRVTAVGFKRTFNGSIEIDYTSQYHLTNNPRIIGSGAPTISPATLTQAQWPSSPGILTQTNSLTVLKDNSGASANKTYIVTDGTYVGELFIHSRANVNPAVLPTVGGAVNVTGIVDRYASGARDAWQIKPRQTSDLATGSPPAIIPTKMAFTVQPVGGQPGQPLATAPSVTVQTTSGQTATTFVGPITVRLKSGTGASGAVLSGATTVSAVNGVATFPDLAVDRAGTDYVLEAVVYGFTTVSSSPFNVGGAVALPGDVDKNGVVDLDDVRAALRIVGGLLAANDPAVSFDNADVDGSGDVTLNDALAIRQLVP